MKYIIYSILFLTLINCNTKTKQAVDKVITNDKIIIKGNVKNVTKNKLYLVGNNFSQFIDIEKDGSFVDTLTTSSGYFYVRDLKNYIELYLSQGNSLELFYDADNFEKSIRFKGKESVINEYLQKKSELKNTITGGEAQFSLLNEIDYKKKNLTLKKRSLDLVTSYDGLPESFIIKEKKNITYQYYLRFFKYIYLHAYYIKDRNFKPSKTFYNELEEIDITNEQDFLELSSYNKLIRDYYNRLIHNCSTSKEVSQLYNGINSNIIQKEILNMTIQFMDREDYAIDTLYSGLRSLNLDRQTLADLEKKYRSIKKLDVGTPSPSFKYYNIDGSNTTLEDLRGNYVLIDVWATWCGPCKIEVPHLERLEKKYHNQQIKFVSISVDKKKHFERWKKYVHKKKLKGIQLFADESFDSDFIKYFQVTSLPSFILLDPEGNIVLSKAPYPSTPEMEKLLDDLLSKKK